jgi:hypoxanthine phosphoribosyltransferase
MISGYDYARRKGVQEITWEQFDQLAKTLTEKLAGLGIEVVIGIARGGLFPATAVACGLRCEFFPVRLTRRVKDQPTFARPIWQVDVSAQVADKVVAVVDEIADTGETLLLAAERIKQNGAARVVTVSLVNHTWAKPPPDVTGVISDALIIFPWDKHVYINGGWQMHPELAHALKAQQHSVKHFDSKPISA